MGMGLVRMEQMVVSGLSQTSGKMEVSLRYLESLLVGWWREDLGLEVKSLGSAELGGWVDFQGLEIETGYLGGWVNYFLALEV